MATTKQREKVMAELEKYQMWSKLRENVLTEEEKKEIDALWKEKDISSWEAFMIWFLRKD